MLMSKNKCRLAKRMYLLWLEEDKAIPNKQFKANMIISESN